MLGVEFPFTVLWPIIPAERRHDQKEQERARTGQRVNVAAENFFLYLQLLPTASYLILVCVNTRGPIRYISISFATE
jgi:hypothetical protein